jgi:hypothetical protein
MYLPSGRGAEHHIWRSRIYETDDINVTRPKGIKKAKHNDLKIDLSILTRSAGLFNECAPGHFFTLTVPEYI